MKIPLLPAPLNTSAGDSLATFFSTGRSWEGALDPGQNAVATAVLASSGNRTGEKGKAKLSVPDKSIYLSAFDRIPSSRRTLITETYVVFKSLHKILNEPGDSWEDDEARLKALQGRPSTKFCQYYHSIGSNYISQLTAHLSRLLTSLNNLPPTSNADSERKRAEKALEKEVALAKDLRDCMSLMVTVYLPRDGEGKAVVGEEVLAWVNETDPQPTQAQLDELSDLAVPYEDTLFWPRIYTCALRGRTDLMTSLLRPLLTHPNPALSHLTTTLTALLTASPRSFSFPTDSSFLKALSTFRGRARAFLDTLPDLFEEIDKVQRGAGALDEVVREDMEASVGLLAQLLCGSGKQVIDLAEDWLEALAGWVRWVDPAVRRDDLPELVNRILKQKPISNSNSAIDLDPHSDSHDLPRSLVVPSLQAALLTGNPAHACSYAVKVDGWLAAHLTDLFDKLGVFDTSSLSSSSFRSEKGQAATVGVAVAGVAKPTLRNFCVLGYGEVLRSDPGLWRLAVEYWSTCGPEGLGRVRAALRRVVVDAETIDPEDDMDVEEGAEEGDGGVAEMVGITREKEEVEKAKRRAGKRPTVREVREVCMEHGLEDEAIRLSKIKANQLMNQRRYGAAVSYCVDARDERLAARMTERLMEEYILNGPEVFTQLVDEIPPSLLDPDAHLFRPDLFTTNVSPTAATSSPEYSRFGSRLAFLARYRDMHAFYARGQKEAAAGTLVHLLATELAPKGWWAILLVDAVPLLEDEQILISSRDTWELLRCLEAVVSPILASPHRRDLYGNLDYLKRIVSPSLEGEGQKRDEQAETEAVLKQLDVVRHALARHLGRCLAGNV